MLWLGYSEQWHYLNYQLDRHGCYWESPHIHQKNYHSKLAAILVEEPDTEASKTLLHDGTELEIPRPQDLDQQAANYSGKKKRHRLKNAVVINSLCLALFVSASVAGKMHDKKSADQLLFYSQGLHPLARHWLSGIQT